MCIRDSLYFDEIKDANPNAEWETYMTFARMTQVSEVGFTAEEYEQSTLPKIGDSGHWLCNNYYTFTDPHILTFNISDNSLKDYSNIQVTSFLLQEGYSAYASTFIAFAVSAYTFY